MNFALLNFVLDAVRDSSSLVCIASSKIPVLLQNYVACLLIQGVKNVVCFFLLGHCMVVLCANKCFSYCLFLYF